MRPLLFQLPGFCQKNPLLLNFIRQVLCTVITARPWLGIKMWRSKQLQATSVVQVNRILIPMCPSNANNALNSITNAHYIMIPPGLAPDPWGGNHSSNHLF